MKLDALIWDYDGTIVDSGNKNLRVTIEVLKHFDPQIEDHLPKPLTSVKALMEANYKYKNWRELYVSCYGILPSQLDEAGHLWTPCQLRDQTMVDMLQDYHLLQQALQGLPMGICSQNSRQNIRNTLSYYGISELFQEVIGHEEISFQQQKPDAEGFVQCLKNMGIKGEVGHFAYVGDHSEDVVFGKNAGKVLGADVKCIAFVSDEYVDIGTWAVEPDYVVKNTEELVRAVKEIEGNNE